MKFDFKMPIPDLTEYGLLPAGVHACTIAEAQKFLCFNSHRDGIWSGFTDFLGWIATLPSPDCILIDGSYVTDKPLPNDVDVVVDITGCDTSAQQKWFLQWNLMHRTVQAKFSVDFYPFVMGQGNDFSAFFQYVRINEALSRGILPNVRKGILRVQP